MALTLRWSSIWTFRISSRVDLDELELVVAALAVQRRPRRIGARPKN